MNGLEKLQELFKEENGRLKPKNHRKWLSYCLGVMSAKMDKTDFDTMREGIKKYEV